MANYNLTNQTISSSFQQLLQKDIDTGYLVDGIGDNVGDITISGSVSASAFIGDGSQLTNLPVQALPSGVVSGSSQIDVTQTTNIATIATTGSNSFIGEQVITGNISQFGGDYIDYIGGNIQTLGGRVAGTNMGNTDGSSNHTGSFSGDGSGLTDLTLPSGIVSGSSQVVDILIPLNSYTASNDTKWSNLGSQSGSFVTESETGSFARTDVNNNFSGNQTFNDITVNGTGSFAHINYVTGSATIIGDAFIVLNTDTPTLRYAGIKVIDSGSGGTASLEWDGDTDRWLIVDEENKSAYLLSGPTGSIGGETLLTNNKLPKSAEGNQLVDSNISDNGTNVSISTDVNVSGAVTASFFVGDGSGLTNTPQTNITALNAFTSSQELLNTTFATTGSNTFVGNQIISGNLEMASSYAITADVLEARNETATPLLLVDSIEPNTGADITLNATTLIVSGNLDIESSYAITADVLEARNETATPLILVDTIEPNNASEVSINGNLSVNGTTTLSGSVSTEVQPLTITSLQTTIDFSETSLFELTLAAGVDTEILASNIGKGQTINLLITQNASTAGTVSFSADFLQPDGSSYVPTTTLGGQDILTLMTYNDITKIYVVATNKFV
jgi:hypothetical protein